MTKQEKTQVIETLTEQLANNPNFYVTDISSLTAEKTSSLRRICFSKKIKMHVVKNSLLQKAMEKTTGRDYAQLIPTLVGSTAILFSESASAPAKMIKEFRKKNDKPILKSAFVEETIYVGDNQLEFLASMKSKNEVIGEIIGMLQTPARNIISALLNRKGKEEEVQPEN